ncbi:MAG TPA: hypothetical protein VMW16_07060 [Sedimentisphaerales bacterium]|nr:hypothetical protein [Sedimentisphaerales bacterium]
MIILILAFFVAVGPTVSRAPGAEGRETALRDGFVLTCVEGRLTPQDSNDESAAWGQRWFFEFDSHVNDGRGRVMAGTRLELLPSSTLEKMTATAEKRSEADYRLWARVTKYKGRNFLLPTYFLSIVDPEATPSQAAEQTPVVAHAQSSALPDGQPPEKEAPDVPSTPRSGGEPAINEPNDVLTVPQEIMDKLKSRRVVRAARPVERPEAVKKVEEDLNSAKNEKAGPALESGPELKQDTVLTDRTGFIRVKGEKAYEFVLDGLGWTVPGVSYGLLPCEALEMAENKQSQELERLRFKAAGIVTKYKGSEYLLLQKATRVYSHGNFAG